MTIKIDKSKIMRNYSWFSCEGCGVTTRLYEIHIVITNDHTEPVAFLCNDCYDSLVEEIQQEEEEVMDTQSLDDIISQFIKTVKDARTEKGGDHDERGV